MSSLRPPFPFKVETADETKDYTLVAVAPAYALKEHAVVPSYVPVPAPTSAPVRISATPEPYFSPPLIVQLRRARRHSRKTGSSIDNTQLFRSTSRLWLLLLRDYGANRPRYQPIQLTLSSASLTVPAVSSILPRNM